MATINEPTQELTELKTAKTRILTGGQIYAAEAWLEMAKNNGRISHASAIFGGAR